MTPPGAIRNTFIFSTHARHGTGLIASRYGVWVKFANTWNFHALLVQTLLHMVFSWPKQSVVRGSFPRALHCTYPRCSGARERTSTSAWEGPMGCTLVDL